VGGGLIKGKLPRIITMKGYKMCKSRYRLDTSSWTPLTPTIKKLKDIRAVVPKKRR